MSYEFYSRLPKRYQVLISPDKPLTISTASKDQAGMEVVGQVFEPLPLTFIGIPAHLTVQPQVLKGLSMDLNLGYTFFQENGLEILPAEHAIVVDGFYLSLPRTSQKHSPATTSIYISKKQVIPAFSQKLIPARVGHPDILQQGPCLAGLIQGCPGFAEKTSLLPWQGAVASLRSTGPVSGERSKTRSNHLLVGVLNVTDEPIYLTHGVLYGTFAPVEEQQLTTPTIGSMQGSAPRIEALKTPRDSAALTADPPDQPAFMVGPTNDHNIAERTQFLMDHFSLAESPVLKTEDELGRALALLLKYFELFAFDGSYGYTTLVCHRIDLKPGTRPVRQRTRPIPPHLERSLKEQIEKWLKHKVIEPSVSEWNSCLVGVHKPGSTPAKPLIRWCIDFRQLNEYCLKDSYPIGDINDLLARLAHSRYFSVIDGSGAFHQIPIRKADRPCTAFNALGRSYQFRTMAFGLCNSPSTYARLVNLVLGGLNPDCIRPYLDDCIIHSTTLEDHLKSLEQVFAALSGAGMKLGPQKCSLFQAKVKFLGHRVSQNGLETDPAYVASVTNWPLPTTRKEVRIFCGKIGYYRKFIKNYQRRASPITDMLTKTELKDNEKFEPSDAFIMAFDNLKAALTKAPVLAFPDFNSPNPFIVDTDFSAETKSMGGVLSQVQNGAERPILYSAIRCTTAQRNYSATKGELCAVICFIKKWKYYLQYKKFTLRTDHQALKHLHTMEAPSGMVARWIEILSHYDFDIVHRAGTRHGNADALSRVPNAQEEPEFADVTDATVLKDNLIRLAAIRMMPMLQGTEHWVELQDNDPDLARIRQLLSRKEEPTKEDKMAASPDGQLFMNLFQELYLDNYGLLRRKLPKAVDSPVKDAKRVIIVPRTTRQALVENIHEEYGHQGRDATLRRMNQFFWFPKMRDQIEEVIRSCLPCQRKGAPNKPQTGTLQSFNEGYPFLRLHIDFVGPLAPSKGYRYILTCLDGFSRWLEAWPTRRADAETATRLLIKEVFSRYGICESLHSDRGTHFTAKVMQELTKMLGVPFTQTPAYNPKANPVERQHRTLGQILGRLSIDKPSTWVDHLPIALFVMRTSVNRTLGMAPYEALFGHSPATQLSLIFQDPNTRAETGEITVQELKEKILQAQAFARKNIAKTVRRRRAAYLGTTPRYVHGDKVWLFTPRIPVGGTKKSTVFWTGPWTVVECKNPVCYEISPCPTWSRKDNQVVAVDRLKKYNVSPRDEEEGLNQAPDHDADLTLDGDEFAEAFPVDPEEEDLSTEVDNEYSHLEADWMQTVLDDPSDYFSLLRDASSGDAPDSSTRVSGAPTRPGSPGEVPGSADLAERPARPASRRIDGTPRPPIVGDSVRNSRTTRSSAQTQPSSQSSGSRTNDPMRPTPARTPRLARPVGRPRTANTPNGPSRPRTPNKLHQELFREARLLREARGIIGPGQPRPRPRPDYSRGYPRRVLTPEATEMATEWEDTAVASISHPLEYPHRPPDLHEELTPFKEEYQRYINLISAVEIETPPCSDWPLPLLKVANMALVS